MNQQIIDLLSIKGDYIEYQQLKNIIIMGYSNFNDSDMNPLIQLYIPQKPIFSRSQCMQAIRKINNDLSKIEPKQYPISIINFNSVVQLSHNQIVSRSLQNSPENIKFQDVLGLQFYKKLIQYGSNGLLSQKLDEDPQKSYIFFHWIQNKIQIPTNTETQSLQLQLLKQVWNFQYDKTEQTIQEIKRKSPDDDQICSIQIGIQYFREMYTRIIENQELKQVFIERKQFEIKYQQSISNNLEVKDFNQQIRQIKQQLIFVSNYFKHIKGLIKDKCYLAICIFLANKEDNYVKYNDQLMGISQISITDKFFYAKKFYRGEDFQNLKGQILQKLAMTFQLDYIILFGTKRQSQLIVQNYLNQTNDIKKAAYISVILKSLIEQSKFGLKDNRNVYQSIIKSYQSLLNNVDTGISRHKFDQICTTIEVERKKGSMDKTFKFNCSKCGRDQCLQSISKRIAAQNSRNPPRQKMRGIQYFSKEISNQIMYCLDCMELLPKCSVCLIPITVYNGYAEELCKNISSEKNIRYNTGQSLGNAIVWCPKCFHGGHFNHMMKWTQKGQRKCAVYSCQCKCQWQQ